VVIEIEAPIHVQFFSSADYNFIAAPRHHKWFRLEPLDVERWAFGV
jgi:hypothetical protein